jgi:diacylglycerol kinase
VILAGLRYTVLTDFTVMYKLVLSAVVLAGCFFLRDWVDALLIIVVTAMVLSAEIMNSAIEAICDFIEPNINPRIKIIKDVSAAGVGVAISAWLIVVAWEAIQLAHALGAMK